MRNRFTTFALGFVWLFLVTPPVAAQQEGAIEPRPADSAHVQLLKTRGGGSFTGRVHEVHGDTVVFALASGGLLSVRRTDIALLEDVRGASVRKGEYWAPNASATRLFFAPTGRMLPRGEGYFSNHELFFLGVAGGVTDRFTLGGGLSVFPTENFADNIFFITPKIGVVQGPYVNIAVGALLGVAGMGEGEGGSGGLGYAVATFGTPDASVTLGGGTGIGNDIASEPIFMLGAEQRVSRRIALVTENYLTSSADHPVLGYGLRFMGEKIAVDLAFINVTGADMFFPGIPYVDFVFHF